MRMPLLLLILPLQKGPEGGSAMTVSCFLFRSEFGKSLPDLREVKQRIVTKSVRSSFGVQRLTFGFAVKRCQRVSIARSGNHADEASGTKLIRNFVQLAQQAGIVVLVIGIA